MKKDKKNFREALLELLLEFVLAIVCFGIGALIVSLFNNNVDIFSLDAELIVLLGVVVLLAIFFIIYAIVNKIRKH